MKLSNWTPLLGVILIGGTATVAPAAQHDVGKELKRATAPLPRCPVMDEPVNLAISTRADEGPVFFCCSGCASKYKADPTKYAEKVKAQRLALVNRPKVQVTCPVTGEPVDGKISREIDGQTIHFCCAGCANKYEEDPKKYASTLANSYTYQTICPVMEQPINPKVYGELATGETIYYCCKGCDERLKKSPVKYNGSLVTQGYMINWAAVKSAEKAKNRKKRKP